MARRARWRRVPRPVWGAVALFALALCGWSVLAPLGRAPDEAAHVDLILHLVAGEPYPEFDERFSSTGVVTAWIAYAPGVDIGDGERWLTAESAPPRRERPTFRQWGGDRPTPSLNQMPQHPPLYYQLAAGALQVERAVWLGDDTSPLDREWHLLRLVNAALVVPLPLLAWAAARRLGAEERAATTAAFVPLAVPQLLHIGASVNNDNLLILLSGIVAVLVAGVLRGDGRRSTAAGIALVASLALLTKPFAYGLLPWIAVAYGYQMWQHRASWRRRVAPALIALVPAVIVGGWWPVRNLVRHGQPFPSALDGEFARRPPGFAPDPLAYAWRFSRSIVQRFWGDFGYFEAPLPPVAVVLATATVALAAAVALGRRESHRGNGHDPPPRLALTVFGSLLVGLLALVAVHAYDLHQASGKTPFVQGRYLFGAVIPLSVIVGVGLSRLLGRWATLAVAGAATLLQADAAFVGLRAWWAEPDASIGRSVAAMVAWSPWPAPVLLALTVASGLTVVATTVVLAGGVGAMEPRAPADPAAGSPGSRSG